MAVFSNNCEVELIEWRESLRSHSIHSCMYAFTYLKSNVSTDQGTDITIVHGHTKLRHRGG